MEALGTESTCVLDVCHNNVQASIVDGCECWLHRKGAAPSDVGPVVIPGSRDSLSYLVAAHGDQRGNLASLAHGAGRKWQRSKCRGLLEDRFTTLLVWRPGCQPGERGSKPRQGAISV